MTEEEINTMLEAISQAPDQQLDGSMTSHLKTLIGKPVPEIKKGVMYVMDMSVHGGLASKFAMTALQTFYEVYLDGKMEEFTDENCPWRIN